MRESHAQCVRVERSDMYVHRHKSRHLEPFDVRYIGRGDLERNTFLGFLHQNGRCQRNFVGSCWR